MNCEFFTLVVRNRDCSYHCVNTRAVPLFLLALVSFLLLRDPLQVSSFSFSARLYSCETPSCESSSLDSPGYSFPISSSIKFCALPRCPIPLLKPGNSQSSVLGICQFTLAYFPPFSHCSLLSDVSKNGALCLSVVLLVINGVSVTQS